MEKKPWSYSPKGTKKSTWCLWTWACRVWGGLKALQEMIKINAQAKVVIASGYSGPDHAKQATANGAAAFMAKPYRMSQMLECVRQVLDAS